MLPTTEKGKQQVIDFIRKMVTVVIDEALMPTGKNLVPTIVFACIITVSNLLFRLLGFPVLLHWAGGLVAIIILLVLLIIERSEYSAVSKLYRDAELRVKDLAARQQAARARKQSQRPVDMSDESSDDDE